MAKYRCILRDVHVIIKLAPAKIQVFVLMRVLYHVFLRASQLLLPSNEPCKHIPLQT